MVGLYFWCYAGLGLTVRLTFRRAPERWGRRKVLLGGMTLIAGGMFCYGLADATTPWLLIVPALICGVGHALVFHTMSALALESFPHGIRGTGSAFTLMMMDVGFIGGAPLLGMIAHQIGYAWMFASIGLTCALSAAVYAWSSVPIWRARSQPHRHQSAVSSPTEVPPCLTTEKLDVMGASTEVGLEQNAS